jgi:probable F420-dependent oxidoreductase
MIELAAAKADGAHPYFVTAEHTARARAILGPDPLLCPEQAVLVEADPDRAREVGRSYTAVYLSQPNYVRNLMRLGFKEEDLTGGGSDALVDAMVAWGTLEQVVDRVAAHLTAGADHVCVQPISAEKRSVPQAQWRELAPGLASLTAQTRTVTA